MANLSNMTDEQFWQHGRGMLAASSLDELPPWVTDEAERRDAELARLMGQFRAVFARAANVGWPATPLSAAAEAERDAYAATYRARFYRLARIEPPGKAH